MRRPCPDVAASMLGLGPDSIASAANLNTLSDSRGCLAPNQLPLTRNLSLPPTSIHTNSPTNPHPPPTLTPRQPHMFPSHARHTSTPSRHPLFEQPPISAVQTTYSAFAPRHLKCRRVNPPLQRWRSPRDGVTEATGPAGPRGPAFERERVAICRKY